MIFKRHSCTKNNSQVFLAAGVVILTSFLLNVAHNLKVFLPVSTVSVLLSVRVSLKVSTQSLINDIVVLLIVTISFIYLRITATAMSSANHMVYIFAYFESHYSIIHHVPE